MERRITSLKAKSQPLLLRIWRNLKQCEGCFCLRTTPSTPFSQPRLQISPQSAPESCLTRNQCSSKILGDSQQGHNWTVIKQGMHSGRKERERKTVWGRFLGWTRTPSVSKEDPLPQGGGSWSTQGRLGAMSLVPHGTPRRLPRNPPEGGAAVSVLPRTSNKSCPRSTCQVPRSSC